MNKYRRILIMTSVEAERDAILRGIGTDSRIDVKLAGVGPISAGIQTARGLTADEYDLVVNMGIAGGFTGKAEVGSLVIANEIISADLGAESPEGFITLDELGFGASTRVKTDSDVVQILLETSKAADIQVKAGNILTLSTVTGTEETTAKLQQREPGALAEAMEGYGVAIAAKEFGIPVLEIRAISNPIGPRDRSAWRIKDALVTLESASKVIAEVL
ncbi:futalosine hydrolase [Fictibacillus phosphorivorans]|uniref:futalosine hydrolase n=1 Tax=Fictibacillus phosphorivorans TaxID=1221500 RepID=UPI00203AAB89|nr:futalosine hydrolase [Fictibacillus phosphorivorans]MCM3719471.1 futalosine hydrolase [Fictibacillus phosphorivorans]MCM3777162.1 futalosine hydrolase [Fictibacillus phosphorivorans]